MEPSAGTRLCLFAIDHKVEPLRKKKIKGIEVCPITKEKTTQKQYLHGHIARKEENTGASNENRMSLSSIA